VNAEPRRGADYVSSGLRTLILGDPYCELRTPAGQTLRTENPGATVSIMSVGLAPTHPLEELRLAYAALQELEKTLANARKCFDLGELHQLDTEIANAWLVTTEIKRRLTEAGKELRNR
jgi:hypothetical protein